MPQQQHRGALPQLLQQPQTLCAPQLRSGLLHCGPQTHAPIVRFGGVVRVRQLPACAGAMRQGMPGSVVQACIDVELSGVALVCWNCLLLQMSM
jgi:hypothetical protein